VIDLGFSTPPTLNISPSERMLRMCHSSMDLHYLMTDYTDYVNM
jgi:hypothetical protein